MGASNPPCECGCGADAPHGKRFISGHNNRGRGLAPLTRYTVDTETGCWLWSGARNSAGYGHFARDGKHVLAHRHFYEHHVGPIPAGQTLDHKCRRTICVNPAHVEPVTHRVNIQRGMRFAPGQIKEIRELHASGVSQREIARRYQTSSSQVHAIVHRRIWENV